ncbi:MAG: hypothetical protein HQK76_19595 [Desulfobacterales bacterium]|nr:hypothetical protein [Desulfobacterales bacterium]
MLAENDKQTIISLAKKFNVQAVFLFGSSIEGIEANDIDIAVRGIKPKDFFDFYGKLLRFLSKPVDVVNLSNTSHFTKTIEQTGIKIYEQLA